MDIIICVLKSPLYFQRTTNVTTIMFITNKTTGEIKLKDPEKIEKLYILMMTDEFSFLFSFFQNM